MITSMRTAGSFLFAVVLALVVAGCGDDAGTTATLAPEGETEPTISNESDPETTPTSPEPTFEQPPPLVIRGANGEVALDPFTFCWTAPAGSDEAVGVCADGTPAIPSPTVVPLNGILPLEFPVDEWTFTASVLDGRELEVRHLSGYRHDLFVPEDLTSDDIVVISGSGPEGDVHVSVSVEWDPDTLRVEVYDSCAWGIGVLFGPDLYLLDGDLRGIEHPGSGMWDRSDFPDEWDVTVWNGSPADGDDWVIRDAVAHRLDSMALDVRHAGTDAPIGVFVLDPTPADQRPACG